MTIIAIGNIKGGVGKTTTALNIGIMANLAGKDCLLVDADKQSSLVEALSQRPDTLKQVPVAHYTDGQTLRNQVNLAKTRYSDIVIDVGGRDTSCLRAALVIADIVLIPYQATSMTCWVLDQMAELIQEARGARDIRAMAFLTMLAARDTNNIEAEQACPDGIEFLDCPVGRRKSFSETAGRGLAVIEANTGDVKSEMEINALYRSLFPQ
jgi:chromosome partitioning protein